MGDLPVPLVAADVDLRDFAFMPIDIVRLFNSNFHALATDAEWRAGVTLWLKSYHQVPASSLPDDDIALARLAELGRDMKAWRKVRAGALRGWYKCADGRLYHRTVAEKALEGWIEKLAQRKSSAAGNAKRYGSAFDPKEFDTAISDSRDLLTALNPQSRVLSKRSGKPVIRSPDDPPGGTLYRKTDGSPDNVPSGSQGTLKGPSSLRSDRARELTPDQIIEQLVVAAGGNVERGSTSIEIASPILDLLAMGCDFDRHVLPTVRRVVPPLERPLRTWGARWLRNEILSTQAADRGGKASPDPAEPRFVFSASISAPWSTIRKLWEKNNWIPDWGARPDEPGCVIPPETLAEIMGKVPA